MKPSRQVSRSLHRREFASHLAYSRNISQFNHGGDAAVAAGSSSRAGSHRWEQSAERERILMLDVPSGSGYGDAGAGMTPLEDGASYLLASD